MVVTTSEDIHKQRALVAIRIVMDGLEAHDLADDSAPPYRLRQWRELLTDAEREMEKAA